MSNDTPKKVTFPRPLKEGNKIAIVAPAGVMRDHSVVYNAADALRQQGWEVEIYPHALGSNGRYSGTDSERYMDLRDAFADPEVRAILCARGGYGVVHILDRLNGLPIEDDPKWVIGFSDISALHALMARKGIASIHSNMCAAIQKGDADPDNRALFGILRGERPVYTFPTNQYDHFGIATGPLYGGNLAVVAELINTPYDILKPGSILFLEDLQEPIYKIERIFYQLRMSGILDRAAGLIVGQFTEYAPDESYKDMYSMISDTLTGLKIPIAFDVPIGHVDHNIPVIEGATVTLKVGAEGNNALIFHRG